MVAIGLLAGVMLAGCGGAPTPTPTTPTGSAATSAKPAPSDVPTVPSPDLDTSRFAADPCGLLTAEQAKGPVGGVRGVRRESQLGPSCRWDATNTAARNNLVVTVNNQIGIADLYARKSIFKVWEPVQIGGYPAVIAIDDDVRDKGLCVLEMGTAQKAMVTVEVQLSPGVADYANPCPRARTIGELVVATLKGGS